METNVAPTGLGSAHPIIWQHWTREHGLPDNQIEGVLQTHDGYVWVATAAGLTRFDGNRWQVLNRVGVAELSTERFMQMGEDSEGNLWIKYKDGLFCWNGRVFVRSISDDKSTSIGPFCVSEAGGIWVTVGRELWHLRQRPREQRTTIALPEEFNAADFTAMREILGTLWLGYSHGILRFEPRTQLFSGREERVAQEWRYVQALETNAHGVPWVLNGAGVPFKAWLSPFDSGGWVTNQTINVYNGSRQTFLFRDRRGTFWLPNSTGRISVLEGTTRRDITLPSSAARDFALTMTEDTDGGLWIGTERSGLLRGRVGKVYNLSREHGLPHENVWALCETRAGGVWVGTDGGVTSVQEGQAAQARTNGLSRRDVRALVEDWAGRIWIGTGSGLNWIENGAVRQYRFAGEWFNSKIRVLLAGRDRLLWVGTAKGLYGLHFGDNSMSQGSAENHQPPFAIAAVFGVTNGLRSDDVRALLEDRAGRLWIGTWAGGLQRLDAAGLETQADELDGHSVWALHEDASGALWLGTDRGLARWKDGHCTLFTVSEGLPNDSLNHILEDGRGQLWLGGERGFYRYDLRELETLAEGRAKSISGVVYDGDEGLESCETNGQKNQPGAIQTRDGRLWFATTKGVVIFDPANLPDQTNAPAALLEQVLAGGETIIGHQSHSIARERTDSAPPASSREFMLRPGLGRRLEFHFTACSFVAGDKLRFKYRLDGLETDWTEAGTWRMAQYANLKPGRYRFQVRAANKYNVWNETGATFAFNVLPFFWQTWWFKIVGVLTPVLAAVAIYRWRLLQHGRLAQAERRAAVSSERAEIARDLHDHLGVRITMMQHLSESMQEALPSEHNAGSISRRLTSLAGELNTSLDSAVWAVQPDKDTLVSLADYLGDSFQELLSGTSLELELAFPDEIPDWPLSRVERYHLALVATEALHNIVKHAHATFVSLRLEVREHCFKLVISDNGCGLAVDAAQKKGVESNRGHGLVNMQQRIERLGGSFELSGPAGVGTRVTITLSPLALGRNKATETP